MTKPFPIREIRKPKSENRKPKTEIRRPKSEDRNPKTEIRTGITHHASRITHQAPRIRPHASGPTHLCCRAGSSLRSLRSLRLTQLPNSSRLFGAHSSGSNLRFDRKVRRPIPTLKGWSAAENVQTPPADGSRRTLARADGLAPAAGITTKAACAIRSVFAGRAAQDFGEQFVNHGALLSEDAADDSLAALGKEANDDSITARPQPGIASQVRFQLFDVPLSCSRPRNPSRRRFLGSGASERTKSATCGSSSTLAFIQNRQRKVLALAGLVPANRPHRLGVGHNLHRLQQSFHPVAWDEESHRFVALAKGEGLLRADQLGQPSLGFRDVERCLHAASVA